MLEVSEPLEMVMDGADEDSKTVATAVVMPPSLLESPHNDPMRILVCDHVQLAFSIHGLVVVISLQNFKLYFKILIMVQASE